MLRKGITQIASGANKLLAKTGSAMTALTRLNSAVIDTSGKLDLGSGKTEEPPTPTKTNDDPDKMSDDEKKRIMRMIEQEDSSDEDDDDDSDDEK